VIGADGEQLGVMTPEDAIERAKENGLDLVEVAAQSTPPVCRIMDYGKYKYEQKKKKQASKSKSSAALKEIKLRPRTDDHDLDFKLKNVRRFLIDGDKVKITIMFRGREIVHKELGHKQLAKVRELLGALATAESHPRMEGRFLSMVLVPNREAVAEERKKLEAEAKAAEAAKAEAEAAEAEEAEAKEKQKQKEAESPDAAASKGAAGGA